MRSSTVTERMVGVGGLDIRPRLRTNPDGALVRVLRLIAHRTRHQPWTDEIPGILGDLAEATGAIRVFLFEGFDGSEGDPSKVLGSWASEHATPLDAPDARRCAAAAGSTEEGTVELGALLLAPIRIGDMPGVIGLDAGVGRRWTDVEGDALATVADLIADAEDRRIALARQQRFAQVPVVVYEATTTPAGGPGPWTYASPRLETLLGFTADEWVGREDAWLDALDPEDVATATDEVRRAIAHGTPLRTEYRLHRRDDRVVWVRDEAEIVAGDDGRPVLRGVLKDVTDRRNVEDAAEHTMRHFREADEQRRGLVRRLTVVQETERARIAQEIDGGSIQAMTAIGLQLDALRPFAERDAAARPVLEQLRRDVHDSIGRMRHLLFELQPRLPDEDLSFVPEAPA